MNRKMKVVSVALLGVAACAAFDVAAQDVRVGKEVFTQCQACHTTDGSAGMGPSLKGIAGRKVASEPGFGYSRAMKSAAITWDAQTLDAFVADPQKLVPGNMMPFAGLDDASQRAALVAFLMILK